MGLAVAVLAAVAVGSPSAAPPAAASGAPAGTSDETATTWEAADCNECHEVSLDHTPHRALERWSESHDRASGESCAACHAGAGDHLAADGDAPVFSFGGTSAENSAVCLSCHTDDHARFPLTSHARAGLECLDCHPSHVDEQTTVSTAFMDLGDRPSASCSECHQEAFAQFAFTERHRLEEGTMECTSCHNPHEPSPRVALGGFKQAQCAECHTEQAGPFVFEHGASRVEGCVACHAPHGSPSRHMLNFQSVAEQCYSCHALVPGFHTRFTADTVCTNCHSTIHGSNIDPAFLQ